MLGLHAVITRDDNCRAHFVQLPKIDIEHFVEVIRFLHTRCIFVLHKIGCCQVNYIGFPFCQQFHTSREDKFG